MAHDTAGFQPPEGKRNRGRTQGLKGGQISKGGFMVFGVILALLANLATEGSARVLASSGLSTEASSVVRTCSTWFASRTSSSASAVLNPSPGSYCFDGLIDATGSGALVTALKTEPANRPVFLVVRSQGGAISESLDVSDVLAGRDVTVAVHTLCGSGCANSLFLPARKRIILDDAVVAFHGGAALTLAEKFDSDRDKFLAANPGADFDLLSREWRAMLERDVARQNAMLRAAGVDSDFFVWFDRMAKLPAARQSPDCATNTEAEAIVFSEDFLRQRGVLISYNGGPRSAEDLRRLNERRGWGRKSCFWQ